jgi:hypothetical protein
MFDFALSRVAAAGSMLRTSGLHLPFHRGFCSWLKAGVVDDDRIVMRGVQSLCYDRISELEGKEDVKIPPKSFPQHGNLPNSKAGSRLFTGDY